LGGSGTWNTTNTNWNTSASGGTSTETAWVSGDTAYFGTTSGTVTVSANGFSPVVVQQLDFAASGYSIAGNNITSVTPAYGRGLIYFDVSSGDSDTMNTGVVITTGGGPILPSQGGIETNGSGTIVLNAANTYAGSTLVSSGTITVNTPNATSPNAYLTVDAGAVLNVNVVSSSGPMVSTTSLTDNGTFTVTSTSLEHLQPVYVLMAGNPTFYSGGTALSEGSTVVVNGVDYYITYHYNDSTGAFGTGSDTALVGTNDLNSGNWSGYAVPGTDVTAASGDWTVPTVQSGATQPMATWVGIDGFDESTNITVEQIGTEWTSSGGYQAFVELYGDTNGTSKGMYYNAYPLTGVTVSHGDHIVASVTYVGSNTFAFSIDDTTSNTSWSANLTPTYVTPSRISAEWIVEEPNAYTSFETFGTVTFTNCGAQINGSGWEPIDGFSSYQSIPINLLYLNSSNNVAAATLTSDLTDSGGESSFSIASY